MKIKSLSIALLAGAMLLSAGAAQAQIFGGGNGRTLLGAGIGAGLGGVLGSNLAGTGVQQEGTAIGAVLGGLAGGALANRSSSRYGSFGPGGYGQSGYRQSGYGQGNFNNRRGGNGGLLGAGLGAIAGGVLGSNLAAGDVQVEGTALGAALGGLAGYGIGNSLGGNRRSNRGFQNSGFQGGGYQGGGFQGGGFQNGGFQGGPTYYPAPTPQIGTFGGSYLYAPTPAPLPAPTYVPSGQFVTNTYTVPSVRQAVYQQPAPQVRHVYHAAPVLAPVENRIIHHTPAPVQRVHTIHVYQQQPAPTVTHTRSTVYEAAPVIALPAPSVSILPRPQASSLYCYSGSSKRYDYAGRLVKGGSCK